MATEALNEILAHLLRINDTQFKSFLNGPEAKLRPFFGAVAGFCSNFARNVPPGSLDQIALTNSICEALIKFLLRLCPSKRLKKALSAQNAVRSTVIAPKKFVDGLLEEDPLAILVFLYTLKQRNGHYSEPIDSIKNELVPNTLIRVFRDISASGSETAGFVRWLVNGNRFGPDTALSSCERESILHRFEFESDDDMIEEDGSSKGESYDSEANGGPKMEAVQVELLRAYLKDPSSFARTSSVRSSPARAEILKRTQMTHEQLEGWAIMLDRNPRKARIMADFKIFHGTK
jgi:hypothetical protein